MEGEGEDEVCPAPAAYIHKGDRETRICECHDFIYLG